MKSYIKIKIFRRIICVLVEIERILRTDSDAFQKILQSLSNIFVIVERDSLNQYIYKMQMQITDSVKKNRIFD